MAYSVDDYYKRLYKTGEKELKDSEKVIRNEADTAIKAQKEAYAKQMSDVQEGYDSALKRNEIQRVLNERYLERKAAEMGLTDSGMNRTQITANQLSYANQKGILDANMQKDINTLAAAMNAKISEIETTRDANISNARNTYSANIRNAAIEARNKDLKYEKEAEQQKAASLYNYLREEKDGYRVFEIDGKEKKIQNGLNPYTRDNNLIGDTVTAKSGREYGFFSNGYQPKGVSGHGKFVGAVGEDNLYGKPQSVWQAEDGTLWYWNGRTNEYELYDITGDGVSNVQDLIRLKKTSK
jgi:hypothetical protein